MTDLDQLRDDLLAAVEASGGLDALDTVRVGALGKQGTITGLLKTLGGMSPEQRLVEGPRIQGLREAVTAAIADRKAALDRADLDARLARETLDMTLPGGRRRCRQRPPGQPGDGRAGGDLRRSRLRGRDRPGDRGRLA